MGAEQSKQIEQEHDDGVITDAQDDEAADWTDVAEPVTEEDAQSREVLVNETPRHEVAPPAPQQHLRERSWCRSEQVSRTIRLPAHVNAEASTADFTNGVLTIVLPKQRHSTQRIAIE